jgi:hypothetical protein
MLNNPGPISFGMQGLADLNNINDIQDKIIQLQHIIYGPEKTSLDILQKLCPSTSSPESLEKNYQETLRKINIINKSITLPKIYGKSILNKDEQKESVNRLSKPIIRGGRRRKSVKKRNSRKKRSSRKKSPNSRHRSRH